MHMDMVFTVFFVWVGAATDGDDGNEKRDTLTLNSKIRRLTRKISPSPQTLEPSRYWEWE
jgi:hypothetical protein